MAHSCRLVLPGDDEDPSVELPAIKNKLLPSTFGSDGCPTMEQRLTSEVEPVPRMRSALTFSDHQYLL